MVCLVRPTVCVCVCVRARAREVFRGFLINCLSLPINPKIVCYLYVRTDSYRIAHVNNII